MCFRRILPNTGPLAPFISTLLRTNNSANVMFSLIIFSSQPARLQRKRIVCCIGPDDVWAQSICSLQFTLFSRRINPSSTNVIFWDLFSLKYLYFKSKIDFGSSIIFFNYLTAHKDWHSASTVLQLRGRPSSFSSQTSKIFLLDRTIFGRWWVGGCLASIDGM